MNTLIVIIHVNHDEFFELASLSCITTLISRFGRSIDSKAVSYTHLTLPTKLEV